MFPAKTVGHLVATLFVLQLLTVNSKLCSICNGTHLERRNKKFSVQLVSALRRLNDVMPVLEREQHLCRNVTRQIYLELFKETHRTL